MNDELNLLQQQETREADLLDVQPTIDDDVRKSKSKFRKLSSICINLLISPYLKQK